MRHAMKLQRIRGTTSENTRLVSTPFVSLEVSLFPSNFCTIAVFSLYGEYTVRSLLPNGVFLPCDHGLDFLHQLAKL